MPRAACKQHGVSNDMHAVVMYMPEELTETPLAFKVVRIPKGMVVFSGRECAGHRSDPVEHACISTEQFIIEFPKRDANVSSLNPLKFLQRASLVSLEDAAAWETQE